MDVNKATVRIISTTMSIWWSDDICRNIIHTPPASLCEQETVNDNSFLILCLSTAGTLVNLWTMSLSPVKMCWQPAICRLQSNSCCLLHIGLHYEPSSRQGDLVFAAYYSFQVLTGLVNRVYKGSVPTQLVFLNFVCVTPFRSIAKQNNHFRIHQCGCVSCYGQRWIAVTGQQWPLQCPCVKWP